MFVPLRFYPPRWALLICFAAGGLFAGCGDDIGVGKTVPVHGKIMLDDKPLTDPTSIILLKADKAKGNASAHEPAGTVDAHGDYTCRPRERKGRRRAGTRGAVRVVRPAPRKRKKTRAH